MSDAELKEFLKGGEANFIKPKISSVRAVDLLERFSDMENYKV